MPKDYPQEFWNDVVCFARQGELTFAQFSGGFGVSDTCVVSN